jgi:hypothetical protein
MTYILIEFTLGLKGQGYQVIENWELIKIVNLKGEDIQLPKIIEYNIVNGEELNNI